MFMGIKLISYKQFYLFAVFFAGIPGLLTAPLTLFYITNIAKLGRKKEMNYELIFSYPNFAFLGNNFIAPILCYLFMNYNDVRPALINVCDGGNCFKQVNRF
jgi:hypothetical protein